MKRQLARTWTASESQDMQAFFPRKYKAEILPALWAKIHDTQEYKNLIPRTQAKFQFGDIFSAYQKLIWQIQVGQAFYNVFCSNYTSFCI